LLLAVGAGVAVWAFRRWRRAVEVAMVLLVLEGALRKWLFPGSQELIYFAKDVILLGCYGGFLRDRGQGGVPQVRTGALGGVLAAAAGYGLVQVWNPALPNLLVGLFGFKSYFLYVPLVWVLPAAYREPRDLARFLYRYALLAIPVGVLALLQFASPASSALNTYARVPQEFGNIVTFGSSSHVRVTATFSFITGYVSFLFASAVLLLSLLSLAGWRLKGNWPLHASLAMTFLGMLLSGSRWPVLVLAVLLPLYWLLAVAPDRRASSMTARILMAGVLVGAALSYSAAEAVTAYAGRALGSTDTGSRLLSPFLQPLSYLGVAGPFGYGIGATHQAAPALVPDQPPYLWVDGLLLEEESARVLVELGLVGFGLVYGIRLLLLLLALHQARRLRAPVARSLATACFLFFLAHLFGGVVFNVTAGVYYWFFAGLLLLAEQLEQPAVAAASPRSTADLAAVLPVPRSAGA
jgi:hypothetical protein